MRCQGAFSQEAKRRGQAKFADEFLADRARAVHAYLTQVLALKRQAQDAHDSANGNSGAGDGEHDLATGLSAAVLGHALRPLLR